MVESGSTASANLPRRAAHPVRLGMLLPLRHVLTRPVVAEAAGLIETRGPAGSIVSAAALTKGIAVSP